MTHCLPNFFVLGTQKGGTTTLYSLLRHHPQIFLPSCKEVHFFSLYYDRGLAWYRQKFDGAGLGQQIGDVTPYYLFHPQVPRRLHELLPNARLLVLLRDPVERSISHYFHACRHGFENLSLADAIHAEESRLEGAESLLATPGGKHFSHQKHSYLSRSRYDEQLHRYLALFPRQQLRLVRSEDLFYRPHDVWPSLLNFLEVEEVPLSADSLPRANRGDDEARDVSGELRQRMREALAPTYHAMAVTYRMDWD